MDAIQGPSNVLKGLSALMTAKLLSPSVLIAVDKDAGRLDVAKNMGADHTINVDSDVKAKVMELTNGQGCDVVIEAVGIPASFELCQDLVAFGGNIANIGVHGAPCQLQIEKLWGYNIGTYREHSRETRLTLVAITMGFVNTTSTETLMKMFQAGTLNLKQLITHGTAPIPCTSNTRC
jgi:alcohol dehydrogenase